MKILIASAANSVHTVRWVNALSKVGIDVSLVYLKNHAPEENKVSSKVTLIPMEASGSKAYFLAYKELRSIYKRGNYDFIHAHFASGYGTLVRMAKIKPAVLSVWGTDVFGFPNKSFIHKSIIKRNFEYFDYITSTSHVMKEEILKYCSKDVKVIPFGVDIDLFFNKGTKPHTGFRIALVKTYRERYGIKHLIEAMAKLTKNGTVNKDVHLDLYGKGPEEALYNKLIQNFNLEENVIVNGYINNNELADLLRSYDLFVLPSLEESFGVSAIEAMASGIPVIASDAYGFVEIIDDGVDGLIVPKANSEAIAQSILQLKENANLRSKLAVNARKKVETLYDWNYNVNQMVELYKEVLNG